MNKTEFINEIAKKTGATKKDTTDFVNAFIETVGDTLANNESISFIGFGTFKPVIKKARTMRAPATGQTIEVPEKTVAKFYAGKTLSDKVNKK